MLIPSRLILCFTNLLNMGNKALSPSTSSNNPDLCWMYDHSLPLPVNGEEWEMVATYEEELAVRSQEAGREEAVSETLSENWTLTPTSSEIASAGSSFRTEEDTISSLDLHSNHGTETPSTSPLTAPSTTQSHIHI